jgi:GWxTD domain-containing protein
METLYRWRCTILSVGMMTALVGFQIVEGTAQTAFVTHAQDGRTAWAVVRESGATLTEVYIALRGESPRHIRSFPGQPEHIVYDGGRLLYTDRGLNLSLLAEGPEFPGVTITLVPGRQWAIPADGGEETPIVEKQRQWSKVKSQGKDDSLTLSPFPLILGGERGGAVAQRVLEALKQGLELVRLAYGAAEQGDFKGASVYYGQAARWFEEMPSLTREIHLSKAVCQSYAEALWDRAKAVRQGAGRMVCADHLGIIGKSLKAYAAAHKGRFPADLGTLKVWVERQVGRSGRSDEEQRTVSQMFRSPVDDNLRRTISYGYRAPQAGDGADMPVVWSLFYVGRAVELVQSGGEFRVIDRPLGQAQVDSLLAVGVRVLEADSLNSLRAVMTLEGVTRVAPNSVQAHVMFGHACLKAGEIDRAEKAFRRAIKLDHKLAEAHFGMGLVYTKKSKGLYVAIGYFQEALKLNPRYVEARYHLAKVRLKLEEYDARREIERAVAVDSTYAPAYRLMGEFYEDLQEDYQNAALWYLRYLTMKPDDVGVRLRLGKVYLKARDFERTTQVLMDYAQKHPEETSILPVLAQACLEVKRPGWAQTFFKRYVDGISPEERTLYEDIRLLAYPEELAEYEVAVAGGEEEVFLKRFWAKRDPDLVTPVNERLLEHYRRVWYARQNFSQKVQPWDRRGEVYIRFGEPDHRSRSNMVNFQQNLDVQRVKERIARDLYGKDMDIGTYIGPVYPLKGARHYDLTFITDQQSQKEVERWRRESQSAQASRLSGDVQIQQQGDTESSGQFNTTGIGVEGNFSSTANAQEGTDLVPWESWVYTKVGGGIEITFTDEMGNGKYDYAPPPLDARIAPKRQTRLVWYAPQIVFERAAATTPDYYVPKIDAPPFRFYYDLADFRGTQEGRSILEIYYGIPHTAGKYFLEQNFTRLIVDRQVALLDLETGATYRTHSELAFQGVGDLTRELGAFVPDVAQLEVPPGKYRLEVTARDRLSGRIGTYRQEVQVADYAKGRLRLSSLELAWQVSAGQEGDKFTKRGWKIVPLPTHTFRKGQNIFVYYEVYNLRPDASGRTGYTVEYTIRTEAGGLLSRLVGNFAGRTPEVAVSQEQAGTQEGEYRYLELDLKDVSPGKVLLTVVVKDLNSGEAVTRELNFTMME